MKAWSLILLTLTPLLGAACQSTSSASVSEESIPNLAPYDGPRATIALREFEWKATPNGYQYSQTQGFIGGLEDVLTNSLQKSDRFWVMERMQFDQIKEEVGLKEDGWIQEGTGPEKGKAEGADLGIYASVTEWNANAGGSSIAGSALNYGAKLFGGGDTSVGKQKGRVAITMRIIDLNSSRVLASEEVVGEAQSYNFAVGGFGVTDGLRLGGGLSQYEDTPMGAAIRKCVAEAVRVMAEDTPQKYFRHP